MRDGGRASGGVGGKHQLPLEHINREICVGPRGNLLLKLNSNIYLTNLVSNLMNRHVQCSPVIVYDLLARRVSTPLLLYILNMFSKYVGY